MNIITYPSNIILLLVSFTLFLLHSTWSLKSKKPKRSSRGQLPPGPRGWPVVGNLLQVNMNRPSYQWILHVMENMKTEIACFRFGHVHVITITSREIAKEMLLEKDEIFADRVVSYSCDLASEGYKDVVLSSYGDSWKHRKKMMATKLMSPMALTNSLSVRNLEADNIIAYVFNLCRAGSTMTTVNVRDITSTYCYVLIMRLMFGRRYFNEGTKDGGLGLKEQEHLDAIYRLLSCFFSSNVANYITFLRGFNIGGEEKNVKKAMEVINKCNYPIIEERVELWREKSGKEKVEDWLDTLVTLKDDQGMYLFTLDEIRAQCKDINLATMDNPMNNVEWVLAEMLNRPDVLEKATKELDIVIGKDRLVQESDLQNLHYIRACSRECFRLYPINAFLPPHVARENTTLGGYFVPKGSQVFLSRLGFGRNPKVWEEPNTFKPERHLSDHVKDSMELNMRFVTFSSGRRSCIATKLGTSMTMMMLARLLQGFQWSLPPGSSQVELAAADGNMLMAKPLLASVKPRLASHMYPKFQI